MLEDFLVDETRRFSWAGLPAPLSWTKRWQLGEVLDAWTLLNIVKFHKKNIAYKITYLDHLGSMYWRYNTQQIQLQTWEI